MCVWIHTPEWCVWIHTPEWYVSEFTPQSDVSVSEFTPRVVWCLNSHPRVIWVCLNLISQSCVSVSEFTPQSDVSVSEFTPQSDVSVWTSYPRVVWVSEFTPQICCSREENEDLFCFINTNSFWGVGVGRRWDSPTLYSGCPETHCVARTTSDLIFQPQPLSTEIVDESCHDQL